MRTAKTLIRLGWCQGWSESSLGAHSFCLFCHVAAHINSSEPNKLQNWSRRTPHRVLQFYYFLWNDDPRLIFDLLFVRKTCFFFSGLNETMNKNIRIPEVKVLHVTQDDGHVNINQPMRKGYLSNRPRAKAQASLCICEVSPKLSLYAQTIIKRFNDKYTIVDVFEIQMSHVRRKTVNAICEQQMHWSACASAQSDQRLCCSLPG